MSLDSESMLGSLTVEFRDEERRFHARGDVQDDIYRRRNNERASWPVHQPWEPYWGAHNSGCADDYPRVRPDGTCESCGQTACATCGCERCQCKEAS